MTCQLLPPLFSLYPIKQRTFGVQASALFAACPKPVICSCNFVKMKENSGRPHHWHLPVDLQELHCATTATEMSFSSSALHFLCGAKGILLSLIIQGKSCFSYWELGYRAGADVRVTKHRSRWFQAIPESQLRHYSSDPKISLGIISISSQI